MAPTPLDTYIWLTSFMNQLFNSLSEFRMIIRELPREIQHRILLMALFDSLMMRPVSLLDHLPFLNWSQIRPRNKQILVLFSGCECRCLATFYPLNPSRPTRLQVKNEIEISGRNGYQLRYLVDAVTEDYIFVA